jgi:hypothetical protein
LFDIIPSLVLVLGRTRLANVSFNERRHNYPLDKFSYFWTDLSRTL